MEKINSYQIEKYLEGLKYPAKKEDIINRVTRNEEDERVVKALKALADEVYESPMEIRRAVENVK